MTKCYQRWNFHVLIAALSKPDSTVATSLPMVACCYCGRQIGYLSDSIARALSDPRRQASCDQMCRVWFGNACMRLRWARRPERPFASRRGAKQWNVINGWPVHRPYAVLRTGLIGRLPRLHEVLLDQFIASFKRAPKKLILDFDATDDPVR